MFQALLLYYLSLDIDADRFLAERRTGLNAAITACEKLGEQPNFSDPKGTTI